MHFVKKQFDAEIMQNILDQFVELTSIRAAFFFNDNYKETVTGRNKDICEFCAAIRKISDVNEKCVECDMNAFKKAEEHKSIYVYRCHMGFWEAVVPIYSGTLIYGFLMLGQVKCADEDILNWEAVKNNLSFYGAAENEIQQLKKYYDEMEVSCRSKIEAAARMLEIIAAYIIDVGAVRVCELEAVERARQYVKQHLGEALSTGLVSKAVNLSTSYFSYLFKQQTGMTFTQYVETSRIEQAKEMLRMTSMTVREICDKLGYEDQNYFSRIFKKYEGTSPVNYRNRIKK